MSNLHQNQGDFLQAKYLVSFSKFYINLQTIDKNQEKLNFHIHAEHQQNHVLQ